MSAHIIDILKSISPRRLMLVSLFVSEAFTAAIVCLMSLLINGRVVGDYLLAGAVTSPLVTFLIMFVLITFIDALRITEKRAEDLLANVAVAAFVLDRQHKVVFWNKACEELTGVPSSEMLGTDNQWKPFYRTRRQTLADIVLDGDAGRLPGLYEKTSRATLAPNGLHAEGWYENLNGKGRYIIFDAAPIYDGREELTAVIETLQDVTSQKLMEMELAGSENHLRTIINTEPECVKLVSRDGMIVEMNPAGLAMIGAESQDEVIGKAMMSLIVPEYRPAMQELLESVFAGRSGTLEFEITGVKGARRWLETHAAPLINAHGEISALLGITHDITERKKTDRELRRNYDTQTAINKLLQVSLEDITLEGILQQALELMLSIPWLSFKSKGSIFLVEGEPGRLVMKAQKGLSDEIRKACAIVPFGKCLCGRAALEQEVGFADAVDERHETGYQDMTAHGHYCVPILLTGRTLGVINIYLREGHLRDEREVEFLNAVSNALAGIIQRKTVEQEREKLFAVLSRSHKEWQDTFDSITDMISIIDRDFNIVKANRAFFEHFELRPQEVLNRKCYEFIHGGGSPYQACPHRRTLAGRKPESEEILDTKTNRIFRVSTFPYYSPQGELIGSIHVSQDITEDKEKEMQLIMSERLVALGQMASGIAHEINNPLAAILGCAEGLLLRVREGHFDKHLFENYLGIIEEEISRCKSITTGMLSFVRKTTYEKREMDINKELQKALDIIGFQGRLKDVKVIKNYKDGIPRVYGNEGELRQAFIAIITNALDAMQDSGALTLETGVGGEEVFVKISDTGPGIPAETIDRIFDPFFTTKAEKGGTGIGLSIANKIVNNHKGHIRVLTEEKKGAAFTITLPLEPQ